MEGREERDPGYDDWFDEPEPPSESRSGANRGAYEPVEEVWVLPEDEAPRDRGLRGEIAIGNWTLTTTQAAIIAVSVLALVLAILAATGAFSSNKAAVPPVTTPRPRATVTVTSPATTPTKPTTPPWKCGISSRGTRRNSLRIFCRSASGSEVLCLDILPFFSRVVSSPFRWLTSNSGSIPIKENRPDSSLRSADSKRNEDPSRPIFWNAPTGVSMSLTISATTGTKFPRSASRRNSSSEGEIIALKSGASQAHGRSQISNIVQFDGGFFICEGDIYNEVPGREPAAVGECPELY